MTSCIFCDLASAPSSSTAIRESGFLLSPSLDPRLVAGWMVLAPERHIEGWDALSGPEAEILGGLIRRAAFAVRAVTRAPRVYVSSFAEAVPHLHVHLFPRGEDVPAEARGPRFLFDGAPRASAEAVATTARAVADLFRRGDA